MRIALLSMTHAAVAPGTLAPAHLRVGPLSVARHQLAVVLALGCQRIVCFSPRFDADMVALQHVAEAAGASFHVLTSARGLSTLVTAADDVIALTEGLLAWPQTACGLLGQGPVVLTQPIEQGLGAGFERLDINHASAGAIHAPGRLVERLTELPGDCDVFSGLQRIALQAGIDMVAIPGVDATDAAGNRARWALIRNEGDAQAVEAGWIRLHIGGGAPTPATAAARRIVRVAGPALLHAGSGGMALSLAAGVTLSLGLVAGWFALSWVSFLCTALACVLFLISALLRRVEQAARLLSPPRIGVETVYAIGVDVVMGLSMAWGTPVVAGISFGTRLFAPVMLLGVSRLVARALPERWAAWLADRVLLSVILALFTLLAGHAWLAGGVTALALACLALGLFRLDAGRP